ncbi:MAG: serine hydrolase domain-containing protein [Spirochaetaceae bacterium]
MSNFPGSPEFLMRRRAVPVILLFLMPLLPGCVSAPKELRSEPEVQGRFYDDVSTSSMQARLEQRLNAEVERQGIPALGVALLGDRERIELAFGTGGPSREELITVDAQFRLGSVTKLYTAVVVLSLVEEGRLRLDQSVSGWFPELPEAEKITIRHLLQHTSGVGEYTSSFFSALGTLPRPHRHWEREQLLRRILRRRPEFEPGARFGYSNSNYVLLGLIAERVTGERFPALLHRYIVAPLELSETYLAPDNGAEEEQLLTGYDYDILPLGNHRVRPENGAWPSWAFTAGGVVSTPGEMARFLSALFEGRLLTEATVERMTAYAEAREERMPEMIGYGLGMRVVKIEGEILYGHTGTIPGFGASLFHWPEKSMIIALAANRSLIDHAALLSAVVRARRVGALPASTRRNPPPGPLGLPREPRSTPSAQSRGNRLLPRRESS